MRSFFVRSDDMPKIGELTFTGGVLYSRCHIALDVPIHSERGQDRADEQENDGGRPMRRCCRVQRRGEPTATGWQPSQAPCVVCMITFTRNPPTTGSAPIAPTADGSHPTPTAAAPAASNATGRGFSAPASESVNCSGAPVILAPLQMATAAEQCRATTPPTVTVISADTRRTREIGWANSKVHRPAFSSATIVARRIAAYSPVGTGSRLNRAAAKTFTDPRPLIPAAAASSAIPRVRLEELENRGEQRAD